MVLHVEGKMTVEEVGRFNVGDEDIVERIRFHFWKLCDDLHSMVCSWAHLKVVRRWEEHAVDRPWLNYLLLNCVTHQIQAIPLSL